MEDTVYTLEQMKGLLYPVFDKYGIKKAVLFGSYGKGTATKFSDVDLLVDSGLRGLKFMGFIEDIGETMGKDVDIFDVSHIEKNSKIASEIDKTGVVIYEK